MAHSAERVEEQLTWSRDHAERDSFRERRWVPWVIAANDILVIAVSFALAAQLSQAAGFGMPAAPFGPAPIVITVAGLSLPIAYFFARLYPGYQLPPVERLKRRICINSLVFGVLIVWDLIEHGGAWSRGMLLCAFALVGMLTISIDSLLRLVLVRTGNWGTPVLLIGAGAAEGRVVRILNETPELGLVPVGYLDDDPQTHGRNLEGVPVLGSVENASEACRYAAMALITMGGATGDRLVSVSQALPFPRILIIPDLAGIQSLWVEPRDIGGLVGIGVSNRLLNARALRLKAVADFATGLFLSLVTLPLMTLIAIAVRIDSRGPVLFSQPRLGRDGKPFHVWKFRTMRADAESLDSMMARDPALRHEYETYHKLRKDPRITRVGKLLRMSSLDELPQFWNILAGHMSLVGPRPYLPEELPDMQGKDKIIHKVRPGLTGLWQVSGRAKMSFDSRLDVDVYYIRNWSLWLDFYIFSKTLIAILFHQGAH